jgi:NAD(P)-dependent dehydrogenase (short-subunit alcohol dehydrogenase family)
VSSRRVAVVAGAENEVGQACAMVLAKRGMRVITIRHQRAAPPQPVPDTDEEAYVADLGDDSAAAAVAGMCSARDSAIHTLINSHFEVRPSTVEGYVASHWDQAIRVNLRGPLSTTLAFLPMLKRAQDAAVVHIGSIDGSLGNPLVAPYSVTKGALIPLTHVLAHDLAPYGIRVNLVARALVAETTHTSDLGPLIEQTPLRRAATAYEVASVAAFLSSADASYVTGAVVPVDGGRSALTPGTTSSSGPPRPGRG